MSAGIRRFVPDMEIADAIGRAVVAAGGDVQAAVQAQLATGAAIRVRSRPEALVIRCDVGSVELTVDIVGGSVESITYR